MASVHGFEAPTQEPEAFTEDVEASTRNLEAPSADASRWASLTARERETAALSLLKYRETAQRMGISVEGVKKHSQSARAKLGLRDKVALALYAARMGVLVPPGDGGGADEAP